MTKHKWYELTPNGALKGRGVGKFGSDGARGFIRVSIAVIVFQIKDLFCFWKNSAVGIITV